MDTLASMGVGYEEAKDLKDIKATSIYEFAAFDIDGANISMRNFEGKVCLIVNVASR